MAAAATVPKQYIHSSKVDFYNYSIDYFNNLEILFDLSHFFYRAVLVFIIANQPNNHKGVKIFEM